MAQEYYEILEHIGSKPVQLTVGKNPDGDRRFRIDVTYIFRGEERRRQWNSLTQLQAIHALLDEFLYGDESCDAADETADTVTGNGTEP
jgi:hypothetical protein